MVDSQCIGYGARADDITAVMKRARDAPAWPQYRTYGDVPFIYEILDTSGWGDRVKELVNHWVENATSIDRAKTHVQREPRSEGPNLITEYCVFRLKEKQRQDWQKSPDLGTRDPHQQTVVFIALEDLSPANGFFITLGKGQDVCVDSKADVFFPPSGGGLGISIVLGI